MRSWSRRCWYTGQGGGAVRRFSTGTTARMVEVRMSHGGTTSRACSATGSRTSTKLWLARRTGRRWPVTGRSPRAKQTFTEFRCRKAWMERVAEPRTLSVTVAWFSPVNRRHQAYRRAKLEVSALRDLETAAGVSRSGGQPSNHSVPRGTVFHERYDGDQAVAFVDDGHVVLRTYCREQAGALDQSIRYGIAVTIEAGEGIPVYDEVRARLAVPVGARVP